MKLASRLLVPELAADTLRPSTLMDETLLLLSRSEELEDTPRPSRMVSESKQEEIVLADVVVVDGGDIEMMVDWDEDRVHSIALSSMATI